MTPEDIQPGDKFIHREAKVVRRVTGRFERGGYEYLEFEVEGDSELDSQEQGVQTFAEEVGKDYWKEVQE